jgi:hypothetical protein
MAFPAVFLRSSDNPQAVVDWFHSSGWHPTDQDPPMGFSGGHGYFETHGTSMLGLFGFVLSGESGGSAVVFWSIPKRLQGARANAELTALASSLPNASPSKYPGLRQKKGVLKFFVPS